jgi:hypothetical protein
VLSQTTPPLATKSLDIAHLQVTALGPQHKSALTHRSLTCYSCLVSYSLLIQRPPHFDAKPHKRLVSTSLAFTFPSWTRTLHASCNVNKTHTSLNPPPLCTQPSHSFEYYPLPRQTYATHIPNSAPLTFKSTIAPILTSLLHTPPLSVRSPHPTTSNKGTRRS